MTIDPDTISLTSQRLIEFGFALGLLATLWKRHWGFAALAALALAESHASLRYPFHVWVRDELLGAASSSAAKHVMQSNMLYVTGMLGLAALLVLTPLLVRASSGHRLMIAGTAIIVAVLAVELISAHHIDAMIYHPQGPFTRAAIAYFIGAASITWGALLTPRRPQPAGNVTKPPAPSRDA